MTLVGLWPLMEDSGSTAYEITGNSNDGNVSGATVGATGILGNTAYSLGGGGDSVQVPHHSALSVKKFTTSVWVKFDQLNRSVHQGIICKGTGSNDRNYWLSQDNGSSGVHYSFYDENGNYSSKTAGSLSKGTWHHIVHTYDGAYSSLYIDGEYVDRISAGTPPHNTTNDLHIGEAPDYGSVDGTISEVRVYARALSEREIAYLYQTGADASFITNRKTL